MGTPNETSWTGVTKLSKFNESKYPMWNKQCLAERFPKKFDQNAINLLENLIVLDPLKRFTAQ